MANTILYNNTIGSSSPTLSQDVKNYKYFRIYYYYQFAGKSGAAYRYCNTVETNSDNGRNFAMTATGWATSSIAQTLFSCKRLEGKSVATVPGSQPGFINIDTQGNSVSGIGAEFKITKIEAWN